MVRLVTSDDIGLVKQVDFNNRDVGQISNTSGADQSVQALVWLDEEETSLAVARTAGSVDIFEYGSEGQSWVLKGSLEIGEPILAFDALDNKTLIVLTESSITRISTDSKSEAVVIQLTNGPYDVVSFIKDDSSRVLAAKGTYPPVVISASTGKIEWAGKQANDTPLGISSKFETRVMVSITKHIFAAADNSGKLRFYNTQFQKKPVFEIPIYQIYSLSNNYTGTSGMGTTRPITAMALSMDKTTLFVGDTYGSLIGIDIRKLETASSTKMPEEASKIGFQKHIEYCRKLFPMTRNIKGTMGSIRDIKVTESTVFAVTAGRFAYAFSLSSKNMEKMFLKQKLTACLPATIDREILPPSNDAVESDDSSEVDFEADDLLNGIDDQVQDQIEYKKRRRN